MSYAIAPTFEANKIGVRRVYTLAGLGTAPDQTTIAELVVTGGYDMGGINTLIAMGATNEQLQALPYPAAADERSAAFSNLMNILSGAQAAPGQGATTAKSFPQIIPSTISTDFGSLDLAQKSTWDYIASIISDTQKGLNQVASNFPNDPAVIQQVQRLNSAITSFSSAWRQVFGGTPPGLSGMGDWVDVVGGAGIIIGGVVMAATVGLPITLAVGAVLATMWAIKQFTASKNAQTAVAQTTANIASKQADTTATVVTGTQGTVNSLLSNASANIAKANSLPPDRAAEAAALRAQAALWQQQAADLQARMLAATTQPGQTVAPLTNWFTQNWMAVAAVLVGLAILPPLIKKL